MDTLTLKEWKERVWANALPCNPVLLRRLRRKRGWTQSQLARIAGYTVRLISKAETGHRISLATIEDLAEALSSDQEVIYPQDLVFDPSSRTRECMAWLQQPSAAGLGDLQQWLDEEVELHIYGHRKVKHCPPSSIGRAEVMNAFHYLWQEIGTRCVDLTDVHWAGSESEVTIWSKLSDRSRNNERAGLVQTCCFLEFRRGLIGRIDLMLDAAAWQAWIGARA